MLRPRKFVRVLTVWALRMVRKLDIAAIKRVRFGSAAGESREQERAGE